VVVGIRPRRPPRGRAHRADAAEEEIGNDRRKVGVAELALGLQPREHPVHHAEEQHREGLAEALLRELGADGDDRGGERRDDAALAAEDAPALGRGEEADVLGEDAVLGLRPRIHREEGIDQAAQPRLGRELGGVDLLDERDEARDVRLGDLDEQLVLVADVVVERGLGDAARLGDLVHRSRRVAAACEQLGGAREDRLALQLVASGASARHAWI